MIVLPLKNMLLNILFQEQMPAVETTLQPSEVQTMLAVMTGPYYRLGSSSVGRPMGEHDSHHPSSASRNSRPGNTGWVSSHTRVGWLVHSTAVTTEQNLRAKIQSVLVVPVPPCMTASLTFGLGVDG